MNRPIPPLARSHGSAWFRIGAAATIVAMSASLTACSGSAAGAGAKGTSTVTVGENSDAAPNGYDPMLYSAGQFSFFAGLYDALFVTDAAGNPKPSLVASSSSSKDNKTLTL